MAPRQEVFVDQPKKRAERRDKQEWEKHRPKITSLYLENDLDTVMQTMADEENFQANKRQYVFQLGKWKVKKYKTGGTGTNGHHRRPSQREDGPPGAVGDDAVLNEHMYPAVPGIALRTSRPEIHEHRTLAADFCSGVSDNETAFRYYFAQLNLHGLDPLAEDYFLMACARTASTTEHAQKVAMRITRWRERLGDQEGASFHRAIANLLLAFVHDRSNPDKDLTQKPEVAQYVRDALGILLDRNFSLREPVLRRSRVFDMDNFMLLYYWVNVFVTHNDTWGEEVLPDNAVFKVLDEILSMQDLRPKVNVKAARTTLGDCLDWCMTTLASDSGDIPPDLMRFFDTQSPPQYADWKADTFVYCYLWYRWFQGYQLGDLPSWTVNSIGDFGVGFSILLVAIIWMFMHQDEKCLRKFHIRPRKSPRKTLASSGAVTSRNNVEAEPGDDAGLSSVSGDYEKARSRTPGEDKVEKLLSPESLISYAKERAMELRGVPEQYLWANVLTNLSRLNKPDEPDGPDVGRRQFKYEAFQWTRAFIQEVLGVDLETDMQLPTRAADRSASMDPPSSSGRSPGDTANGPQASMVLNGPSRNSVGDDEDETEHFDDGVDDDGDEDMKGMGLEGL